MQPYSRDELLAFLNEMLEAERAGAKALLHISKDAKEESAAALAMAVHHDEARWCAMLIAAIRLHSGTPSDATGAFYEKVLAIGDAKARLSFVNRGQGWVVKKLKEAIPRIEDEHLVRDLTVMLASHEENIAKVNASGLSS
jgi:nitronate monooxygenase